jgi:hypothetical protein
MKGEAQVVAGSVKNKVQAVAGTIIPEKAKAQMHRKLVEPGSGDK